MVQTFWRVTVHLNGLEILKTWDQMEGPPKHEERTAINTKSLIVTRTGAIYKLYERVTEFCI